MPETSPTVRQRELGARLRQLRCKLDRTVEEIAQELLCSTTKIERIETGARRASLRDVRDLCRVYGIADTPIAAELMDLVRLARESGWWRQYDDLAIDMKYFGLEQAASTIGHYGMYAMLDSVPTGDYAWATIIPPTVPSKMLEDRVEYRMRRQVGGFAVMRDQLDHILRLAREGKVKLQVIPSDVGAHICPDISFECLEFVKPSLPGLRWEIFEKLAHYHEALEYLQDMASADEWVLSIVASMQAQTEIKRNFSAVSKRDAKTVIPALIAFSAGYTFNWEKVSCSW